MKAGRYRPPSDGPGDSRLLQAMACRSLRGAEFLWMLDIAWYSWRFAWLSACIYRLNREVALCIYLGLFRWSSYEWFHRCEIGRARVSPWSAWTENPRTCNQRGVSKVQATKLISSNMVAGVMDRQCCSIQRWKTPTDEKAYFWMKQSKGFDAQFCRTALIGCMCVLLVTCIYLDLFSNTIIISISCCFLAEKVERL